VKTFAELSIQIKLLESGITGVIDDVSIPNQQIVSPGPSILNTALQALQPNVKMFILSDDGQPSGSVFDDDSVWVDYGAQSVVEINNERFNGAIVNGMSGADGTFATPIVVTITGLDMIGAVFFFGADEWPTEAIFNGQTIVNNRESWFIADATSKVSTITVTFTKWNKPNRPFRLRGLLADFMQEYGEEQIDELTIDDASANNDLYTGVKSGRIKIKLFDINGEFKSLKDADLLTSGITLITKFGGKNFAFHRIGNWHYDDEELVLVAEGEQRVIAELDKVVSSHTVTGTVWDLYNDIKSYDPNKDVHFVPAYLQTEWQAQTIDPIEVSGKLLDIWNKFLRSCFCAMIDEMNNEDRRIRIEKDSSVVPFADKYAFISDNDAKKLQSNILFENTYEGVSWNRVDGSAQNVGVGNPVFLDIGFVTPKDLVTANEIINNGKWDKGKLAVYIEQINPDTLDEDDNLILSWEDGQVIPLLQRLIVWNKGLPILTRTGYEIKFVVVNRSIQYNGGLKVIITARQE
jgi:hypothetical protein